jgi:hypothetical protein
MGPTWTHDKLCNVIKIVEFVNKRRSQQPFIGQAVSLAVAGSFSSIFTSEEEVYRSSCVCVSVCLVSVTSKFFRV